MSVLLIALAALLAAGLALRAKRARDGCVVAAALLTPVLLVAEVSNSDAFTSLVDRPAVLAVLAVAGLVGVGALAALFVRVPTALPLAAVAALPFRIPVALGGSTSNLLVPLYLVVAAGVAAYAWERRSAGDGEVAAPSTLERVLAVVLLLYALQATYSDDLDKAIENVVFFYAPFTLLFVLFSRSVRWTRAVAIGCLGVLAGLAVLFVSVGFWEYATKTLLLHPKVLTANEFEEYFRVTSLFFDPNIYGRFLAIVMLAIATLLIWVRAPRVVAAAAVVLAVLWAGLVLTFSQSSFTALIVGLGVLAGLRWNPRLALGAAGALTIVGLAVVLLAPGAIRLKTDSSKGLDNATSGRYDLISGGIGLAEAKPVLGWGSGSFARTFRRRETATAMQAASASHTIPITVAAEQGLAGLAAYLALMVVAFVRLGRGASRDPVRAFVLAAFAALTVHTMLYAAFLEDPITWALLAVGVALAPRAASVEAAPEPGPDVEARRRARAARAAPTGA